jgi:hypothetical protein
LNLPGQRGERETRNMANLRTRTILAAGGLLLAAGAPRIDPAQASAARTSMPPPSMSASGPSRSSGVGITPRDDGDDTGDEGDGDDGGDDDRSEA